MADLLVVRFSGSKETAIYLDARQREAARGELIGIAAIAMYGHNHYAIAVKGEIRRAPIYTRGLLPELDQELTRIIRRT